MIFLILSFFFEYASAATAQIDFVAHTNVPGVTVEGKATHLPVTFDKAKPTGTLVEFDVFQLETGMDKRDQHLREKVFAAKKNGDAKIRFEVTELTDSLVKGTLAIKGVSHDVSIPLKKSGDTLSGNTQVSLSEYSLPRPSFMGVKVEEAVDVHFSLQE